MSLKTLLFNKAFYKTNIKRFGFIFAIYFFITEILMDYFFIRVIDVINYSENFNDASKYEMLDGMGMYYLFSVTLLSAIFSVILFHYIQKEKSLTSIHSMPVSRKSLYFTNYAVFLSLMGVTMLVHFILVTIHMTILGFPLGEFFHIMAFRFIFVMLLALAIFSFTTFIGMIVSNFILQLALVSLFLGLPIIIYRLMSNIFSYIIVGYGNNIMGVTMDIKITPYYFLQDIVLFKGGFTANRFREDINNTANYLVGINISWLSIVLTLVMIVASITFGYILYKKRDLERCHDFIVFDKAKHIITFIIMVVLSLIFANIIGTISISDGTGTVVSIYIGAFIGAMLGYVIMKLISEKSINVIRFLPKSLVFSGVALLLLLVVDLDVIGYENKIPDANEVELVSVYAGRRMIKSKEELDERYGYKGRSFRKDELDYSSELRADNVIVKLKGDDIAKFMDKHKELIQMAKKDYNNNLYKVQVIYFLKDGKKVEREYSFNTKDCRKFVQQFVAYDSNIKFLSDNYDKLVFDNNWKRGVIFAENTDIIDIDAKVLEDFLEAYKKDIISNTKGENKSLNNIVSRVNGIRDNDDKNPTFSFQIDESFKNSLDWIKNNGYSAGLKSGSADDKENISNKKMPKSIDIISYYREKDGETLMTIEYDGIARFLKYERLMDSYIIKDKSISRIAIVKHYDDGEKISYYAVEVVGALGEVLSNAFAGGKDF